jgi:hypothetical protein
VNEANKEPMKNKEILGYFGEFSVNLILYYIDSLNTGVKGQ